MKKIILVLGIVLLLSISLILAIEKEDMKPELTKDQLAEKGKWVMENYQDKGGCGMGYAHKEAMIGKGDYANKECMMRKSKHNEVFGFIGFGIVKLLSLAIIAFMVSAIFWLTHNWLVKKK